MTTAISQRYGRVGRSATILGIGGSVHDFASCLIRGGALTVGIEEERLSGKKHHSLGVLETADFRLRGPGYCLRESGLLTADLVYANDLVAPVMMRSLTPAARTINHHLSHAAACFLSSPFPDAAILVADGFGSLETGGAETVSYFEGAGTQIRRLKRFAGKIILKNADRPFSWINFESVDDSLGGFYSFVTALVGFGLLEEGKTMGLAAYGSCDQLETVRASVEWQDGRGFRFNSASRQSLATAYASAAAECCGTQVRFQLNADYARAAQIVLEEAILRYVAELREMSSAKTLCLAGGVFLNCVANSRVRHSKMFDVVHVHGAAGDSGTALGAALYGYSEQFVGGRRASVSGNGIYLGRTYSREDIEAALTSFINDIVVARQLAVCEHGAHLLSQSRVIGWFQGSSEFGPRALGNRSILADPRSVAIRDRINREIKKRESFRPLAPAVAGDAKGLFVEDWESPYMTLNLTTTVEAQALIGGAVHIDGSSRVQTVRKNENPLLYALITEFRALTGVPAVLNTSFNRSGPIVETPMDAIECMLECGLDHLIISDFVVSPRSGGPMTAIDKGRAIGEQTI